MVKTYWLKDPTNIPLIQLLFDIHVCKYLIFWCWIELSDLTCPLRSRQVLDHVITNSLKLSITIHDV